MAISAENQCSRSRVAGPMSCSRPPTSPAQMPIDSSITLPRRSRRPRALGSARDRCCRARRRAMPRRTAPGDSRDVRSRRPAMSARSAAPRQTRRRRRVVMLTRPASTSGSRARTDSISQTQAPHCRPSTARVSSCVPSALGGDEAREVATFGRFGARCAQGRIEDPLRVVAAEAEGLDGLVRRGAAGAAEAATCGGGQAAVAGRWWAGGCATAPRPSPAARVEGGGRAAPPLPPRGGGWRSGVMLTARSPAASPPCRDRRAMPTASAPTAQASAAPHPRRSARHPPRWNASACVSGAPSGRSADAATDAPRSGAPSRSVSVTSGRPAASVRATTVQPSAASRCSRSSTAS